MPLIDHFGALAPFYDRFIKLGHVEKLIDIIGLPVNGILLDAGGGTGRVAQALRGLAGDIVVADESTGMLRKAAEKGGLIPVCSHAERLSFADAVFDRIIMVDALHHVADYRQTVREMWRVLKPGGRIVIEEPNIDTASVKLVALIEKLALMRSYFVSPKNIKVLFDDPTASSRIEVDGVYAWVVADKSE